MKYFPDSCAIDSLTYAQVCTRLDIAFKVNLLEKYLSNHRNDCWINVKKVTRYLQKTKNYMLIYEHVVILEVQGYSYFDFTRCPDDMKSLLDIFFMLTG